MIPFLTRLQGAKRVLIAGCGGGFDIYAGMPLASYLISRGHSPVLANLSFSRLEESGCEQLDPVMWRIDSKANDLPYFPERWLHEWLVAHELAVPVYAFSRWRCGVRPLADSYRTLMVRHAIDLVVLVDGDTDSVIFGDEPGLGTVVEDAVSIVATHAAAGDNTLLVALGFGIDHFHGVSHHSFLENVARLTREGAFLGGHFLVRRTPEADAFLELVDYANRRQPGHRSIVCNSIASALRGEFGNHHATDRTGRSELFINPLMTQYWAFDAGRVVADMAFASALTETESFGDAELAIETVREGLNVRKRSPIPL